MKNRVRVGTVLIALAVMILVSACGKKQEPPKDSVPETSAVETPAQTKEILPDTTASAPARDSLVTEQIDDTPPLLNKRWKLVLLNGDAVVVSDKFKSEPYITLSVHSERVHGSGGCNRFGAKYRLEDQKVSFAEFRQTDFRCPDVIQLEKSYLNSLKKVTGYELVGEDTLWLTIGGKRAMKFEAVVVS
ncbi:MAG: META domain-containing protein [Calditrichaeota bacterium]|nr:META domain-containing protein [Calditrichota bacterium]